MDEDRRDRTEVMSLEDPTVIGFRQDIAAWIRELDRVEADITYAPSIAAAMTADIISRARCRYDLINVETPGRPFDDGRPMPEPAVESDCLPVVLRLVPSDQAMSELHEILAMRRRSRGQRSEEPELAHIDSPVVPRR